MEVNLLGDNPYKNWSITAIENQASKGKTYTQITYQKDGNFFLHLAKLSARCFAVVLTLGCSEDFKRSLTESYRECFGHTVTSDLSFEKYLLHRLKQSKSAKKLYDQAVKAQKRSGGPKIAINFLDPKERIEHKRTASALFKKGTIQLALGTDEHDLLSGFVFELGNFKHQKKFRKAGLGHFSIHLRNAKAYAKAANAYAKRIEKVEHRTTLLYYRIAKQAVDAGIWDPLLIQKDVFMKLPEKKLKKFDSFWKEYLKHGMHPFKYRLRFILGHECKTCEKDRKEALEILKNEYVERLMKRLGSRVKI